MSATGTKEATSGRTVGVGGPGVLFDDVKGPALGFLVEFPDVGPDHSHEEKLQPAEKEKEHRDGGPAGNGLGREKAPVERDERVEKTRERHRDAHDRRG